MGFEDGIRVLAASILIAFLLEVAVIELGDGAVGHLAALCAAKPGQTFQGNDIAQTGMLIAHLMPIVIVGTGFIYGFIKIFQPGRMDARRGRRVRRRR